MDIVKKTSFCCLLCLLAIGFTSLMLPEKIYAQQIIPQPQSMVVSSENFDINVLTKVYTNLKGKEKRLMRKYLASLSFPFLKGEASDTLNVIRLIVKQKLNKKPVANAEEYALSITPSRIEITANSGAGLFYGLQSMLQLSSKITPLHLLVSCAEIKDKPRFNYRGLMLDVSRHFFPKNFILKQIDALAYYKINTLHLHLTDGGGWRIQIKKYPKLTKMTAYRPDMDYIQWRHEGSPFCKKTDKNAYGGYYTQHDIREIVKYAAVRHITILPEIDMPGHSDEVLAAYPELACTGKNQQTSSVLCVGKEITFRFYENILKEVMKLFPCEYIHIGGDEADRTVWDSCPLCKKRMQDEHLKDVAGLQNYFTRRIEYFLNAHDRKLVGWDEIMDGDLPSRAVVMSYREQGGDVKAVKGNHPIIMSPATYCYLDHYQDAPSFQPRAIGGFLPLENAYTHEPIPATENAASHVMGVQGNLWTEFVPTPEHAEYMIYPRILALAETGWTEPQNKNWDKFHQRALNAVEYLKMKGYHPFDLKNEIGRRPESLKPVSHLALDKTVNYNCSYSEKYRGSDERTLTDGRLGDWTFRSDTWQGFLSDIDVVIDLDKETDIHSVSASFMQSVGVDMFNPAEIVISTSDDAKNFTTVFDGTYSVTRDKDYFIRPITWNGNARARYIRYQAKRDSNIHGWLFTDEIIVK